MSSRYTFGCSRSPRSRDLKDEALASEDELCYKGLSLFKRLGCSDEKAENMTPNELSTEIKQRRLKVSTRRASDFFYDGSSDSDIGTPTFELARKRHSGISADLNNYDEVTGVNVNEND